MQKLSIIEMKSLIGGGDDGETGHGTKSGDGGETGQSTGGETSHGNRSNCIAIVRYRHSNHPAFTRVANCGDASKEGGTVLSCSC